MFKKRLMSLWINNSSVNVTNGIVAGNGFATRLDLPQESVISGPAQSQPDSRNTAAAPKTDNKPSIEIDLVERDGELQKLKSYWQAAIKGEGRVVLMSGEAGHGKSSLAEILIQVVQSEGGAYKIARAACSAQSGKDEPFWPFADAMSQLVAAPSRKITGDVVDAFLEFAPSWVSVIPVAGPVVGASLKTAQVVRNRTKTNDSPNPEKLLREYVGALKKVTDKQPVLMFIDDLHWSDAASIKLLSHLSRNVRGMRILVVGAYRPSDIAVEEHPLHALISEVLRYDADGQMQMQPLSQDGVRQLVQRLYPANKFPPTLAEYLYNTTSGAPLFIVESLRLMQSRGEIINDAKDGKYQLLRDLNEGDLPRSVEAIINKRLERLPEALQEMLALAAVQGSTFDAAVLAYVTGQNEIDLMKTLEPAERVHGVIDYVGEVDLGHDVTVRYRFTSNLFQRQLLETLRGKQRLTAYRKTAEGLDRLWPDDSEDIASKLAVLYEQGKIFDNAARFMCIAGHYARQSGSITRAIELYEQAEKALNKAPAQENEDEVLIAKLRQQIDEALSYLYEVDSSYDKADTRTRRALSQGLEVLGWRRYASLRMRLAALAERAGRFLDAHNILQTLFASLEATRSEDAVSAEAFQLKAEMATVQVMLDRVDEGVSFAEEALRELDALPDMDWHKAARARITTALALGYHARGEYQRALDLSSQTLLILNELNMVSTYAALLSNLVELHIEMGQYEKVHQYVREMIQTAKETSNESLLTDAYLADGEALLWEQKPKEALAQLELAEQYANHIGIFEERPKIWCWRAFALVATQQLDAAQAAVQRTIELAQNSGSRTWEAYAQMAQANVLLAQRDVRAVEQAISAASHFIQEGTYFDQGVALLVLARAQRATGHADAANECYAQAITRFNESGNLQQVALVEGER